jgi:hypothetical protein
MDNVSPTIQATASHVALAPLRWLSLMDFSICQKEGYSNDGFSTNLTQLIQFGLGVSGYGKLFQWLVLVVCVPVLIVLATLELILVHGSSFATLMMSSLLVILAYLIRGKSQVAKW